MSLFRMAGLIALPLVATTLQTGVRPVVLETPAQPAQPEPPAGVEVKVAAPPRKPEPVVVLTPNPNVWRETGRGPGHDGIHPGPAVGQPPRSMGVSAFIPMPDSRLAEPFRRGVRLETGRAWLIARYPHAPPV